MAAKYCQQGIELFPNNFQLYEKKASLKAKLKKWPSALEMYKEYLKLNTYNPHVFISVANVLINLKDNKEAI